MAFTGYHNILGATAVDQELLAVGDTTEKIKNILLTNAGAVDSAAATVSLFIVKISQDLKAQEAYYMLKNVSMPPGTSLLLDDTDMVSFNNSASGYALYITVGSTDKVDVIITQ